MKIKGVVTNWVVLPALRKITLHGDRPPGGCAHAIEDWGWVDYRELGNCVQTLLLLQGVMWPVSGSLTITDLFECYGALEVTSLEAPSWTWCTTFGVTLRGPAPTDQEWGAAIYVPAKVSTGILSVVEKGIVKVETEARRIGTIVGGVNTPRRVGYKIDGKKYDICNSSKGDGSYSMHTYEELRVPVTS